MKGARALCNWSHITGVLHTCRGSSKAGCFTHSQATVETQVHVACNWQELKSPDYAMTHIQQLHVTRIILNDINIQLLIASYIIGQVDYPKFQL